MSWCKNTEITYIVLDNMFINGSQQSWTDRHVALWETISLLLYKSVINITCGNEITKTKFVT